MLFVAAVSGGKSYRNALEKDTGGLPDRLCLGLPGAGYFLSQRPFQNFSFGTASIMMKA
jgi:hypothetical protein